MRHVSKILHLAERRVPAKRGDRSRGRYGRRKVRAVPTQWPPRDARTLHIRGMKGGVNPRAWSR